MLLPKIRHKLAIVCAATVLLSACTQTMSKKDAEKSLKAFDNEIITLYQQILDSEGYKCFKALSAFHNLPFPVLSFVQSDFDSDKSAFSFSNTKGIYQYSSEQETAVYLGESDSILFYFPYRSEHDSMALFVLAKYAEEGTKWGTSFPVEAEMQIKIQNHTIFELKTNGKVKYNIPVAASTSIKMGNALFDIQYKSRLNKRRGRFYLDALVFNNDKKIGDFNACLTYNVSKPTEELEKVKLNIEVFPLKVDVHVNSHKMNELKNDYIDAINELSQTNIKSQLNGKSLGTIKLRNRDKEHRINHVIIFEDETLAYLEDIMLSYKHIMNLRYPEWGIDL